eukprot:scaffold2771_cov252-Pinguiococcus_pyrenoidosus.AAC.31
MPARTSDFSSVLAVKKPSAPARPPTTNFATKTPPTTLAFTACRSTVATERSRSAGSAKAPHSLPIPGAASGPARVYTSNRRRSARGARRAARSTHPAKAAVCPRSRAR